MMEICISSYVSGRLSMKQIDVNSLLQYIDLSQCLMRYIICQSVIQMGNKQRESQQAEKITPEQLETAVQFITRHQGTNFTKKQLQQPIQCILQYLGDNDPFDHTSGYLKTSPSLIKMFYNPNFPKQMMKVLKLLIECLEDLNQKSLSFLKVQETEILTYLCNFILFATNEKISSTFDSMLIRTDIDEENKALIKEMERQCEGQLEVLGNLVEKISEEEKQAIEKLLRVTIMSFIKIRNQTLSRSDQTLKHFTVLEYSLFMLYTKLYFSSYTPEMHTPTQKQSYRYNMTIGAYFLASGTSYIQPSIYETAVIFIYSVLKLPGIEHQQIKTLPSHYFKNLPVIASNSLYDYIVCNTLFSLKYVQQSPGVMLRFGFNRIVSLKLVHALLEQSKSINATVKYYLEELCLQVQVGQIERACLYEIVKIYSKLDGFESAVMSKFLENGNKNYNLKFADRQIKVKPNEVITELEDEVDTSVKEYMLYSQKYLNEKIFLKPIHFVMNDRSLWNQILPGILDNKQDEQIRVMSALRKEGNSEENSNKSEGQEDQPEQEDPESGVLAETEQKLK